MINHKVSEKVINYIKLLQELNNHIQVLSMMTLQILSFHSNTNRNIKFTLIIYTLFIVIVPITPFILSEESIFSVSNSMKLNNIEQKPLSNAEKLKQRTLNLCLYCDQSNHEKSKCFASNVIVVNK